MDLDLTVTVAPIMESRAAPAPVGCPALWATHQPSISALSLDLVVEADPVVAAEEIETVAASVEEIMEDFLHETMDS